MTHEEFRAKYEVESQKAYESFLDNWEAGLTGEKMNFNDSIGYAMSVCTKFTMEFTRKMLETFLSFDE